MQVVLFLFIFYFYRMDSPKEQAYQTIAQLTDRFNEQVHSYKKGDYNEHLVRTDFIDPFLKPWGGTWITHKDIVEGEAMLKFQ